MLVALSLAAMPARALTVASHPFIRSFDGSDSTAGAFGPNLGRVAVRDATGDIYVVNPDVNAVEKFDSSGAAAPFTTAELPPGSNALDGSNTPDFSFALFSESDVAVDNSGTASDGTIYVNSEAFSTVYAFDATGSYLYKVSGLNDSCGIAVDAGGNLWIAEYNTATVSQYTAAGVPTGTVVNTSGQGNPCHIAFDSAGNLYANMYMGAVEKYDSSGTYVGQLDPGTSYSVAVDRSNDHVYVDHGSDVTEYDASGARVGTIGSRTVVSSLGVAVDSSTGNASSGNVIITDGGSSLTHIFGPLTTQHLPDVTTGVATNVGPTSARIGGIFNADGLAATCAFEYGTDTSYGSTAACTPVPSSGGTSDVAVHADLSGLTPGTTYHYRLTGTSADGTNNGLDQTFTTPQAPTVGASTATAGVTSATLKATVNPQGAATTYHFEYGTTTSYGASAPVPDASVGSGTSDKNVSTDISGLTPGTTYHFRLVATNVAGTTTGADHVFTTRAAPVADTCPNAQVRQQQGSSHLPDCRAWELVTQADKARATALNVSPPSPDGNRIMYDLLGGAPGTSSGAYPILRADRTAGGWTSASMMPPATQLLGQTYTPNAASLNADGMIVSAYDDVAGTPANSPDVSIARLDAAGNQTLLHRFPTFFGTSGVDLGASDDLSHVYANVPEAIDASHQSGTWNVYDFGSGTPQLVGTMPGTGLAPTCGALRPGSFTQTGFIVGAAIASEHWTSTDGGRIFFQSRGDDAPTCDDPVQLYTHDRATGRSTLLSGPPLGGDPDNGVDRFLQATPDGSIAFFRTPTSLAAADDVDGNASDNDIYRWTAATGDLECITCDVAQADVLDPSLVSADGSHVYFSSLAQHDGAPAGATNSQPNTYVWRADGTVHFIAQTDGVSDLLLSGKAAQATPNGDVLVFNADTADLNARSGADNGGMTQYYRYDDRDESITCISCPADGSAPTGAATTPPVNDTFALHAHLRMVSDDGSTVVFPTPASLVPEDSNDARDLYEWRDGKVGLITSGTASPTIPSLVSLTADGHDVFFTEIVPLTWDAQDASNKLYDARVGGGFAAPPGAPSPCQGDQCRGPVAGAPGLQDPASDATESSGGGGAPARLSLAAITARQRAQLARTGRLRLHVRVNHAGKVSAVVRATLGGHRRTVAHAAATARKAGTVTLRLRLSHAARQRVAHGARLRLTLIVRFGSATRRVTLTLVPATADGR